MDAQLVQSLDKLLLTDIGTSPPTHPPTHPPTYTTVDHPLLFLFFFFFSPTHLSIDSSSSFEPPRSPLSSCAIFNHPPTHPDYQDGDFEEEDYNDLELQRLRQEYIKSVQRAQKAFKVVRLPPNPNTQ